MTPQEIKLKRTESLLKDLILEAIASIEDDYLAQVVVVDVACKKGKYDADVYLDSTGLNETDKKIILRSLKEFKAEIEEYCLQSSGWYRCPKLHFKFDQEFQRTKRLDEIFKQIRKEQDNNV